jgi:uncharacterized protein (TIRG00374 family)
MNLGGWKVWIRVVIGCSLLLALLVLADWRQGLDKLLEVNWGWALLAALLIPVTLYISTWKWQLFVAALGLSSNRWQLLRYYWAGFFFNNFLPSNVGGDISRLALLRRTRRLAEFAASILVERLVGLAILLLLAIVGLVLRPHYFDFPGLLPLLWIICTVGLVGFVGLYLAGNSLAACIEKHPFDETSWTGSMLAKFRKVVRAMLVFKRHPKVLVSGLVLSLAFYAVTACYYRLLFFALGLNVAFSDIWFIFPLVMLVGLIPISFNAVGIAEGAFVLFFCKVGLAPGEALAAAFLSRILGLAVSAAGGILYLFELTESPGGIN